MKIKIFLSYKPGTNKIEAWDDSEFILKDLLKVKFLKDNYK